MICANRVDACCAHPWADASKLYSRAWPLTAGRLSLCLCCLYAFASCSTWAVVGAQPCGCCGGVWVLAFPATDLRFWQPQSANTHIHIHTPSISADCCILCQFQSQHLTTQHCSIRQLTWQPVQLLQAMSRSVHASFLIGGAGSGLAAGACAQTTHNPSLLITSSIRACMLQLRLAAAASQLQHPLVTAPAAETALMILYMQLRFAPQLLLLLMLCLG